MLNFCVYYTYRERKSLLINFFLITSASVIYMYIFILNLPFMLYLMLCIKSNLISYEKQWIFKYFKTIFTTVQLFWLH